MIELRFASVEDARAIREIYAPYVTDTAVSFEYEIPSVEEFEGRINNTLEEYPYLVALDNGEIVGYAYASAFHQRAAYKHSAELSIYIRKDKRRDGLGRLLYNKLEEILLLQNVNQLHACIAYADEVDEHLNNDSKEFHEKMGFKVVGKHELCGYKFGKWYSMIWMDKLIAKKSDNPKLFVAFSDVREKNDCDFLN